MLRINECLWRLLLRAFDLSIYVSNTMSRDELLLLDYSSTTLCVNVYCSPMKYILNVAIPQFFFVLRHWMILVANMASYAICSEFDFGDS
jgi:hypothetical protein